MRLKFYFLLSCLISTVGVSSQVIITLQLPPLGLTVKPQLWNLSLVNTNNQPVSVKVEVIMTDAANNQQVMTGVTNTFLLAPGIKQLQPTDVMPVTYNVSGAGYNVDASPNGFLPVGLFHFCYIVTKVNTDAPERLGEECETVEIEPLSPPQLLFPADSDRVESSRPLFAWMPPSPLSLFSNLNYEWKLVEVMPTQSGADAIQQNVPLLSQSNISFTSLQYPLSLQELDTSRIYAWRVTAKNNTSFIANSEVWTFRIQKAESNMPGAVRSAVMYTPLRRETDAAQAIASGHLHFVYKNEINSNSVQLRLIDLTDPKRAVVELDSPSHSVSYGMNYISLDLRQNTKIKNRHVYLLELFNEKRERWYIKFEYRKPD